MFAKVEQLKNQGEFWVANFSLALKEYKSKMSVYEI